jgi:phosphotransferase system enzyme I (PtsP)
MPDFDNIRELISTSNSPRDFMNGAVVMVAKNMDAAVCSFYLYNEGSGLLTLRATYGLSPDCVGKVQLHTNEGLVGKTFKEDRPVCVSNASQKPEYKFCTGTGEDAYDAFLAVPIRHGIEKIGVAVVQRKAENRFSNKDVKKFLNLTAQFASAIETIRALWQIKNTQQKQTPEQRDLLIHGESASPGYALAPCIKFQRRPVEHIIQLSKNSTGPGSAETLRKALHKTAQQLEELQISLGKKLPEIASLIFESHIMMIKDESFTDSMIKKIEEGLSTSRAVAEVAESYIKQFNASSHAYLREKARDVEDLALRLLSNISDTAPDDKTSWKNRVLIARELLPSDILKVTLEDVAGIIQVGGGITSHISILVRSLNIPMIIVDDTLLLQVPDASQVLMDAYCGNLFVNPSEETINRFNERERVRETAENQKSAMAENTTLSDGTPVNLLANINLLSEIDLALDLKAQGIGLYRTEFPFLVRQTLPSEDEQYSIYTRLLVRMPDKEVTIRTLDAGGDKVIALFDDSTELNPALGLRSTRLTLRYADVFNQQIRAILRASIITDKLNIMFPMIASIDDFLETKNRVLKCIDDLREEGVAIDTPPKIGLMVEMPAVLEIIDDLAELADFFSIGTNDFIQYMLAADRTNERVAQYYIPHHPAILRGLKRIADAAISHNIPCSVCGEMAHDERYIPFLIGIGIKDLSVDPHYLPDVQRCLLKLSPAAATDFATKLLAESSIKSIEKLLTPIQSKTKS